jgi:hypothetical protein
VATASGRAPRDWALPAERQLGHLRALTLGGENAEAYWAWGGGELIMQARPTGDACDRIFRLPLPSPDDAALPRPVPVSSGRGATTCSYFLPGDKEVIYASTEGGSPACPPRPDHSQGYVWALYPDYDIYRAGADGAAPRRLTTTPGYDAEGTVCAKDGSIVFTSVRDGDIDLYRMDKDGHDVRRLTHDVGYDGGAFFNADCTKIVWRASRPKPGRELDDYQRLLSQNLVRPTKLELYVANADGSEATQVTYLDAASFGPAWEPGDKRLVFASNYGDPRGREFDIWAIDVAGTRLERITTAPGFDGFPLFSPDGKHLAFSSNRATPPGAHDTNVFVADWRDVPVRPAEELPADRVAADVRWLADPAREGRGIGTTGLAAAGTYIEERFRALGLQPAGDAGTFVQKFEVRTRVAIAPATRLVLAGASPATPSSPRVSPPTGARRVPSCSRATGCATLPPASTTTRTSTCAARSSSCAASCPRARRTTRPSARAAPAISAKRPGSPASAARAPCSSSTCRSAPRRLPPIGARPTRRPSRSRAPKATPTPASPCSSSSAPSSRRCSPSSSRRRP